MGKDAIHSLIFYDSSDPFRLSWHDQDTLVSANLGRCTITWLSIRNKNSRKPMDDIQVLCHLILNVTLVDGEFSFLSWDWRIQNLTF